MLFHFANAKFTAYYSWRELSFYNVNSDDLTEIYRILKNDIDFVNFYSQILLLDGNNNEVIRVLESSKHILMYPSLYLTLAQAYANINQKDIAENYFKIASNMVPNRFSSKYLRLKFYYEKGEFIKARELAKDILTMKVKVPSKDIDEIKSKVNEILMDISID